MEKRDMVEIVEIGSIWFHAVATKLGNSQLAEETESLVQKYRGAVQHALKKQMETGIRILFAADLHGDETVFRDFALMLRGQNYDIGIIAGDLKGGIPPNNPIREEELFKLLLSAARKPILVLPGNHDRTPWNNQGNVFNINMKSVRVGKFNIVGLSDTEFDADEATIAKNLDKLTPFMRENTILVTHIPPWKIGIPPIQLTP